ncbi:juvenile hormone esterase-like [Aricia agestis]|uniref:juvenile hormone esterase-like n=1 Tax=Aricia agestis TaxID=91739 RepID=UPI001C20187C|nr:juvenile hormone esterase-like [Aricia agestis]
MVQVKVHEGILEGEVVENEYGKPFCSFKGIRYAQPPVGDLRFKAPQPAKPWQGVRSAKEHGPDCYHYDAFTFPLPPPQGSEDCLYLNVYTPTVSPAKPLPVMVWIHGGGFISGSGSDMLYGPEFVVRKDVILVTLNYRLEVLGFLCLDTEDIPGNAGMKDQVAALRWIKKNIKSFGGDPNNITIFGESAGGVSVSFHLISPMSKGLFNKAIMQSGTVACWWPNTFRPRDRALQLAKQLGCESSDDKEIYEFFKKQPVEDLIKKRMPITFAETEKEAGAYVYLGVVSEKKFGDNETFIEGDVYDLLRRGIHEGVTVINGYNEDEGAFWFQTGSDFDKIFHQANKYLEYFVPEPLTINCPIKTQLEIGKKFKEFYMKGKPVSRETLDMVIKFFGMEVFAYGAVLWQKICAKRNRNKLYMYKFTCVSERNCFKYASGTGELFGYRTIVSHSDELGYLFPMKVVPNKVERDSEIFQMVEQFTTLWTNFAKFSDPTPDDSLQVRWKPYTLDDQAYLDIGEKLVLKSHIDKEEVEFWENIFREYYPHVAP